MEQKPFYKLKDLTFLLKLSRSTIYKMLKSNNFPKPSKISGTSINVWNSNDIENWLNSQFKIMEG
jgi:predicted DNA-binding transcriptional regulator AlpA